MSEELARVYADLDGRPARFIIPFRSLFLCGGVRGLEGSALSLRDYLCRKKKMNLRANIVFAESATQLYRDTSYEDLISFEEDIARVASLVFIIAESPGALAELGAFSMNRTISENLRIMVQSQYEEAESFIRYGPIKKIQTENDGNVAFFPWELNKRGAIVAKSVAPHYVAMKNFIAEGVDKSPKSRPFYSEDSVRQFYIVYWALYHAYAASLTVLHEAVCRILPQMSLKQLKNILYCLKLVGWVSREAYSNKDYYFALGDSDPVVYKFSKEQKLPDIMARKFKIRAQFEAVERLPRHIKGVVAEKRAAAR